jgi:hypothetical protein
LIQLPYWIAYEICIEWMLGAPFALVGLYIGSRVRKS